MRALTLMGSKRSGDKVRPPTWTERLVDAEARPVGGADGLSLEVAAGKRFTLASVTVDRRMVVDAAGLRDATVGAYGVIHSVLAGTNTPHPVRFWNHISDITKVTDGDCNRYMAFNAGRYQAMSDWYGGPERFDASLPTASGVGYDGDGLIVHCLAGRRAGRAVANPRQVQPHRYSARYGPKPPCFARATILSEDVPSPLLLIGGTASIRGEESMFGQDLPGQFQETLANLASLLKAAGAPEGVSGLATMRDVRVYYRDAADAAAVTEMVRANFSGAKRPEIVRAGLCRAELLVEIEGIAEWGDAGRVDE
jgi:chorismate lyase/3-hydroxybenzoate synthase